MISSLIRSYRSNPLAARRAIQRTQNWVKNIRKYPDAKTRRIYENPEFHKLQDLFEKMVINENKGTLMSHGCTKEEADNMIEQAKKNPGGKLDNRGMEFYGGSSDMVTRYTGRSHKAYVGSDKKTSGGQEGTGHTHIPAGADVTLLALDIVENIEEISNFKQRSWFELKGPITEQFNKFFNEEVEEIEKLPPSKRELVEDL